MLVLYHTHTKVCRKVDLIMEVSPSSKYITIVSNWCWNVPENGCIYKWRCAIVKLSDGITDVYE